MSWLARRARSLVVCSTLGLAAFAAVHAMTEQPAAEIRVRWHAEVSPARRAALERELLLANGEDVGDHTVAYDLLDLTASNLRALLDAPEVADTGYIDRQQLTVAAGRDSAHATTWVANRIPLVRDATVRLLLIAILTAVDAIGLAALAMDRRWTARILAVLPRPRPMPAADIFDRLAATPPPAGRTAPVLRMLIGALLAAAIGVPILTTTAAVLLAMLLLAVVFGTPAANARRLAAAVALAIVAFAIRAVLPRADIAEAHNAFLVVAPGEALERGLPPGVFASWKAQFDALYPPDTPPYAARSQWRDRGAPKTLFAASTDALWRHPRYSRQVDAIGFRSLAEFRGGFANEADITTGTNLYNFWDGEIQRQQMPFYVMYELTPAAVGSRLTWTGQAFWQRADGGFDEITHRQLLARTITPADAGRRVYAAFFPQRGPFEFRLEPSLALAVSAWVRVLVGAAAAIAIVGITVRPRPDAFLRAVALFASGYASMLFYGALTAGVSLTAAYGPHRGGDDGLVHDGWGRLMAILAARGRILDALKGVEDVYWFTPGTRYMRMFEKLVFGDTNLLYGLCVAALPIVLFDLVRHFLGKGWAWTVTAAFVLLPVANPALFSYVANAQVGYGEAIGGGLFLLGLALLLRSEPLWGGGEGQPFTMWVAGAALAASMFIRPNFAFAVVWLGAVAAWLAVRRQRTAAAIALVAGLAIALWMPLHNWYYGGQLYLISRSGATISVPLRPVDYARAVGELLQGRISSHEVALTAAQLRGWLWSRGLVIASPLIPLAWAGTIVRLVSLVAAALAVVSWRPSGTPRATGLAVVAVTALCAHAPMLFVFATPYRYGMLAWDLSMLVLLVRIVGGAELVSPGGAASPAPVTAAVPMRS